MARWDCEEAGGARTAWVPYAWQHVGPPLALASAQSPRHNILGSFDLRHAFPPFAFEGASETQTVIPGFKLFPPRRDRPAVGVGENAPLPTSEDFAEHPLRWPAQDRAVQSLPPSGPDLTRLALLWRTITYEGLPLKAAPNFKARTRALFAVRRGLGPKYRITFA